MKRGKSILLLLLLSLTLWRGFYHATQVRLRYGTVSLRYRQPLTVEAVESAKTYMSRQGGSNLTFWAEKQVYVISSLSGAEATQISFDGEAAYAFPAEYCYGTAPVGKFCAVSTSLAEALWGAESVVGLSLTLEDTEFTVCGVFREDTALLLQPGNGPFTAAEIHSIPSGEDGYRYGSQYAQLCGLPAPDQVLLGDGIAAIAASLPWFCAVLAGFHLCWLFLRRICTFPQLWRRMILFGIGFSAALSLPWLLARFPGWLLPTKWSDFSFWQRLEETFSDRFKDFIAICPASRDISGKMHLLQTAVLSVLSVFAYRELLQIANQVWKK